MEVDVVGATVVVVTSLPERNSILETDRNNRCNLFKYSPSFVVDVGSSEVEGLLVVNTAIK